MQTSIERFLKDWGYEAEKTQTCLDVLTDASLRQAVTPDDRTLGRIAWHLVQTIPEMMGHAGLHVSGPAPDAGVPVSAKAIADEYRRVSDSFVKALPAAWTDATLSTDAAMYGETWKRGFVLSALMAHQTHHRGQMTVLMRQAGLKVPGIYGPSREEWAAIGMPAPAV